MYDLLRSWGSLESVSCDGIDSQNLELEVVFLAERNCSQDTKRINRALRTCSQSHRMELLRELLSLWRGLGNPGTLAQEIVFGDLHREFGGKELMATMTGNGCQFRLWYAFPGPLGEHHVDGGGDAALLNVSVKRGEGEEWRVQKYAKMILEVLGMKFEEALQAPNGAKLWWYITDKA